MWTFERHCHAGACEVWGADVGFAVGDVVDFADCVVVVEKFVVGECSVVHVRRFAEGDVFAEDIEVLMLGLGLGLLCCAFWVTGSGAFVHFGDFARALLFC